MTPYTRYQVGNKQFVVEWNLTADAVDPVDGEKFELVDCELVSIFGITPESVETRLMLSNHSEPDDFKTFRILPAVFLAPFEVISGNADLPPNVRWMWPVMLPGTGVAKLSFLFRAL